MKSTSGKYYIGLDHIRALAIFMVFCWHFINTHKGQFAPPPVFPLSFLTEGYTGVSLFMTLSGYLFAKLLDGKNIIYYRFLWNRILRLLPLLLLVLVLVAIQKYFAGQDLDRYKTDLLWGLIKPTLPNGAWSITTEFHFYLILPVLLLLTRQWKYSLIFVVLLAVVLRISIYHSLGQIQTLSYWTIIGRIDQFLFGILAFTFRRHLTGRHFLVLITLLCFALFYRYFDSLGGFFKFPSYPSPSAIWIYLPTIEGFSYAVAIAWYDTSFKHGRSKFSQFIAVIGAYSYSIYLLHFFMTPLFTKFINFNITSLKNIYTSLFFASLTFFIMIPIAYLSFRFIESPFLRYRINYLREKLPKKQNTK